MLARILAFAGLFGATVIPSVIYAQKITKKAHTTADSTIGKTTAPIKTAQHANTKAATLPAKDTAHEIQTHVNIQAKFPGGDMEWRKYLEKNFNRDIAVENGAPPGNYTVVVSFVVGADGSISDVRAENDPGYGVAGEAIKIIKNGPKWIPAIKNGHCVAYRQRQSFIQCSAEE